MTDRLHGVLVHFTEPIREDDADQIINALKMVKYVGDVTPVVAEPGSYMAESRAYRRIRKQVYEKLGEVFS